MSNVPRIHYVVEGATDFFVLDALVERFLGADDYIATQIQPPTSEYTDHLGPLGGGWRGVLRWCADIGSSSESFAESLVLANCDCLIIHVDADIAAESELAAYLLSAPCPPARATCDNIRNHLLTVFGGELPAKVVLCVPAQCTEAWVFAALHSEEMDRYEPLECRTEVERLLIGKRDRLVRDHSGRARKQTSRYRDVADRIAASWDNAKTACAEALRFETECSSVLSDIQSS